jgi:hypothetical protein
MLVGDCDRCCRAASAKPYVARGPIIGVCIWLPIALALDVAAVALGQRQWLEAAGVILLVGALAQAVLAVLLYLTPMLRGRPSRRGSAGRSAPCGSPGCAPSC